MGKFTYLEKLEVERRIKDISCPLHPTNSVRIAYFKNGSIDFGGCCRCPDFISQLKNSTDDIVDKVIKRTT